MSAFPTIVKCAAALVVILLGAAFFTNAVKIPGGTVGSAAGGGWRPARGRGHRVAREASKESAEIGVSAIPGAPFGHRALAFASGALGYLVLGGVFWLAFVGGDLSQRLMGEAKRR